jgi:hypothetical protein
MKAAANILRALILAGSIPALTVAGAQRPERSCRAEIGTRAAAALVRRCRYLSPATHPPCNALNPCSLIREEIERSCAMFGDRQRLKACRAHSR